MSATQRPVPDSLDPADWNEFRRLAHELLDDCIDSVQTVRERAVWKPVPAAVKSRFDAPLPRTPVELGALLDDCRENILPYATGNVHPRFFGWVHGAGTPLGILSEMLAATMNSNCGGRDHVALNVERQVVDWCREIFGMPTTTRGVLTVGTSMATVLALSAARRHALGAEVRVAGNGTPGSLVGYCSRAVHVSAQKAFELLGLGSASLRAVAVKPDFTLDIEALSAAIAADRAAGLTPFVVVGTAGTVNTGACDDLLAIATVARRERVWLHVDGAFGAWAAIADPPRRALVRGIDAADSLVFDFHKWISVPYDAGCVLIRDGELQRAAFAERPDYLATSARGLAGGDPWPCDYGIDLSRSFRALKVWMALRHFGVDALGEMVAHNCATARHLGALVDASPLFELAAPVTLSICCFSPKPSGSGEDLDRLTGWLAEELQLSGIAAPSLVRIGNRQCLRVAVMNHRTRNEDVELLLDEAARLLAAARAANGNLPGLNSR